jgi:hypothetical protein
MNKARGNQLGDALRAHRQECDWCTADRACLAYIDIASSFTRSRVIREGPVMGHTRLSVREAKIH